MKRKDFEDKYENFFDLNLSSSSSPSSKSRRLNPEACPYISEDVPVSCTDSEIFEPLQPEPRQSEPFDEDFVPATNDERAIVLYNPQTNPTLYRSPARSSFSEFSSVVVNSDLIPGLKEQLFMLEKGSNGRSIEIEDTEVNNYSNNMAMVPWVARQTGAVVPPPPGPMEDSGEVEMMDVENDGSVPAPGFQQHWQQQQHWLRPELLYSNTHSPVTSPVTW